MARLHLILRMALGGGICGSFLGIYAGAILGGIYGVIIRDFSFGLEGALFGAAVLFAVGILYGALVGAGVFEKPAREAVSSSPPAPPALRRVPAPWPPAQPVLGPEWSLQPENRHLAF